MNMSFASFRAPTMEPLSVARRTDKENVHQVTPYHKPRTTTVHSKGMMLLKQKTLDAIGSETKQEPRRALGNLSNICKDQVTKCGKIGSENLKKTKIQFSKHYPDIEKMPNNLDVVDDYEDILPKSERLSLEEMQRLTCLIPFVNTNPLEIIAEEKKTIEYDEVPFFPLDDDDWSEDFNTSGIFGDSIPPLCLNIFNKD